MVHNSCCVVNCKNTGTNSQCKFYTFPRAIWKLKRREKWINAVRRKNVDGSPWTPKPTDTICSDHFIGGRKSEEEAKMDYIVSTITSASTKSTSQNNDITMDSMIDIVTDWNEKVDKDCQVNFLSDSNEVGKTFISNRYMYMNAEKCDAEIQTEINDIKDKIITNRKKYEDKTCNTLIKNLSAQSTETSEIIFLGFKSISKDEQLTDLAAVTFNNFKFLLKRTSTHKCTVAKEDRLLIFLMKIKTGLTFSALSVLFSIHRITVSRIYYTTLQTLHF
ncbi:hypothetical protein PV325_010211 [Microctonus aethiopoides]|nr:hypothetical protein PV325_010211 [Microctonus aethiopoides]KAK0075542.1 hypothetical protein PV326_011500 [Microctonus aethiopoides]